MDNKKQTDLNPQLKAIYERVMATKISVPSGNQAESKPAKDHAPQVTSPHEKQEQPPIQEVNLPTTSSHTANAVVKAIDPKKKHVSSMVLVTAVIIFFLAYTIFWFRFFNVKLPFSLPF